MRRAALLVLLSLACAGCTFSMPIGVARQVPARGGSVTEAIVGRPGNLNPLFASEDDARDIDSLVYQGLTQVGPDQQPRPLLAASWSLSPDGLTYTFTMREGVRWADGAPFTREDVLFTFALLQDPTYDQPDAGFWREVTVEAAGPTQVKFTLKAPSASFPISLRIGILPRHAFKDPTVTGVENDRVSSGAAFGTGPFRVQSVSPDRSTVTLVRNPHAKPAPYLDRFVFQSYATAADAVQAVSSGQADAAGGVDPPDVQAIRQRPDLVIQQRRTFMVAAMLFNPDPAASAFFTDAAVRRAVEQAVDRAQVVHDALLGFGDAAQGPIPPSDWAYFQAAGQPPYDPAAAAAALDAAGWKLDPVTGIRTRGSDVFRVQLDTADAYPYLEVGRSLAAQLRRIGIEIDLEAVPASVLISRYLVGRHFALALAAFDNGPDPDQWSLWHSGQPPDSLSFSGMPKQALIDKDLEDGRAASVPQARITIYADFQELIAEAVPGVFLYEPHYLYVLSSRVKGVRIDPVIEPGDRFDYVAGWYVQTSAG